MARISCTKLAKRMIAQRTAIQCLFHDSSQVAKLLQQCDERGLATYLRSQCEAYGQNVQCYLGTDSNEDRRTFERWVQSMGGTINRRYWPGSGVAEISVSYFKAWHHDI